MKKRIIISESERESILSQHKQTIKDVSESKKQSLSEREMSKLITNVLMNESPSNFNKNLLTEVNFCNQNICASQGYATGTCNYFGNGTGNCVFADGSVCGWTTASEAGGGEFAHWTSGPCGMSTQGGTRPSKLPKPTTTTTTTTPKPVSKVSTTTMKESVISETLSGPAAGDSLNSCGTGSQLCWSCTPISNGPAGCPTQTGVYMGWSISDQNTASGCGCTSWSFGMPLPQYAGRKLPKPATTTTTPKPVSNTTTTMKESIVNRLFRKVISEMKNSECQTNKDCGGLPCVNGQCKNRTEVKEVEGCFNPTCSRKSDKECSKGKKCINGKCTSVTNREMKEDTELYERATRVGDSCNCGSTHTAGVVKCGKMGGRIDCWCDCSGAQKDPNGDGYPG